VAFDYSREMLAAARGLAVRRGWRNIEFVQGDAAVLEVEGAPVDGVLCVLGISAIPDHRRALERCRAVLRPGGALVVCDARPPSGLLGAVSPLVRRVYGRWAAWHPDRDIVGDLRRLFGEVAVQELNLGTFFIARASKPRG
jgi:ubiquinone/menaquinone biosynthesis C-methylase UbiE